MRIDVGFSGCGRNDHIALTSRWGAAYVMGGCGSWPGPLWRSSTHMLWRRRELAGAAVALEQRH
eukprot:7961887-Pyramimonas_sp.AAC.1